MTTVYGYPARDDIVAGQTYTVTIPPISRDKRFADAVKLVKGIGEYQGSTASYDESIQTWTVTLAADAKGALDDLRLAEAKYGADVVAVPGDHGYAQASADHAAISTPAADPFKNIPNADDSLNGEFSPAKVTRPTRVYDITDRAGRALMILVEAHEAGLPMPGYVTVSAHNHGDFRSSSVRFQFASDSEVGEWANHFARPFVSEEHGSSVTLEQLGQHDVQAYHYDEKSAPAPPPVAAAVPEATAPAGIPGLAEHTQAAPATQCTCEYQSHFNGFGHPYQGCPAGDRSTKETGPICDDCADTHYAEFVTALADVTQAACDTITKAAQ